MIGDILMDVSEVLSLGHMVRTGWLSNGQRWPEKRIRGLEREVKLTIHSSIIRTTNVRNAVVMTTSRNRGK